MSAKQILLHWLSEDDLSKVLKGLMFLANKYKDEQVLNNATFQSGRLKALEKQKINGTFSHEEEQLQSAKIREAFLHIIKGLPDDWTLDGMENAPASFGSSSESNWKRSVAYFTAVVAVLAGISELSGYSVRDLFKQTETTEQPVETSPAVPKASTTGNNSPAVITNDGDVNINYGEAKPKNDTIMLSKKPQK